MKVVGSWKLLMCFNLVFGAAAVFFFQDLILRNIRTALQDEGSSEISGFHHPPVLYGHVHMGKTAGTALNGELAMHYERVCGHKGYSYDAFQTNRRFNASGAQIVEYDANDIYYKMESDSNRGRVPEKIMDEIGYEDCDYISVERGWKFWRQFNEWGQPLELHVPCREPIEHLMSQCNNENATFQCQLTDLVQQADACVASRDMIRFSRKLTTGHFKNIQVKCFDNAKTFTHYMKYMDTKLQKKRFETAYVPRRTNKPRHKEHECIWNDTRAQETMKAYMIKNYDYYSFCDKCLGSENDLFANY